MGSLRTTPHRIENRYGRRIGFAFVTLKELLPTKEISELFNIVPIEEIMRQALKKWGVKAISGYSIMENKPRTFRQGIKPRQKIISIIPEQKGKVFKRKVRRKRLRYRLDFAIFCKKGKINIECDDLRWHSQPKQRVKDKKRDRWLKKHGWTILRFTEEEIKNHTTTCLKIVKQTIQNLEGFDKVKE